MSKDITIKGQHRSVSTGFDVSPVNLNEAMQLADMISRSQLAPKNFQGKAEDTLVAMMMGNEIGLNPLQAIQNIAVINGRPSIWGDALLALVQNHPKFKSIEESFNEETMTASCTITREGGKPHTETFSRNDAIKARLWDERENVTKGNYTNPNQSAWYKYPKRMLAMRARGFALRNQFADALLGLITREEAQDLNDYDGALTSMPSADKPAIKIVEDAKIVDSLPLYPHDRFIKKLEQLKIAIPAGKITADDFFGMVESKNTLTEEQKDMVRSIK